MSVPPTLKSPVIVPAANVGDEFVAKACGIEPLIVVLSKERIT